MGETTDLFAGLVAPVRVVFTMPDDLGTADAPMVCRGSDGCDYVVKDASLYHAIPHSEWFCSELGERVGIAAPSHKVMDMGGGKTAFGSRWQGGPRTPDAARPWYDRVKTGEVSLSEASRALSRIYAFDQFVHNLDRHTGNLLVLPQFQGHAFLAFDYSQAWTCLGFPLSPPPLGSCQTVTVQRQLSKIWGKSYIEPSIVKETCEDISRIPPAVIENIIDQHPLDWLPVAHRQDIIKWWGSEDMALRLNRIVEGVENGDCL